MTIEVQDARQIRAIRAALGWSLTEMGHASGLHRNTVLTVERCTDIKRHRLAAMSIALAGSKHGVLCELHEGAPIVRFAA